MNDQMKLSPRHILNAKMSELCLEIRAKAASFFWGENNEEILVQQVYWNCTLMAICFETDGKFYNFTLDMELHITLKQGESEYYFER